MIFLAISKIVILKIFLLIIIKKVCVHIKPTKDMMFLIFAFYVLVLLCIYNEGYQIQPVYLREYLYVSDNHVLVIPQYLC